MLDHLLGIYIKATDWIQNHNLTFQLSDWLARQRLTSDVTSNCVWSTEQCSSFILKIVQHQPIVVTTKEINHGNAFPACYLLYVFSVNMTRGVFTCIKSQQPFPSQFYSQSTWFVQTRLSFYNTQRLSMGMSVSKNEC